MKTLICLIILTTTTVKQIMCQDGGGIVIIPPNSETTVSPQLPHSSSLVSFKIVDFIRFDEKLHEAEFIFTFAKPFSKTPEQVFTVGSYRSLEEIQKQIIPTNTSTMLVRKYRVTLKCKTFLVLYPHDSHLCTLPLLLKNGSSWIKDVPPLCGGLSSYNFHIKGYLSAQLPGGVRLVNLILERTSGMQIFGQMYSPLITLVSISFFTLSKRGSFTFRIWTSLACILGLYIVSTILWENIPRTGQLGSQTAIEHYIVICIGLAVQNVLINILTYWYLSQGKSSSASDRNDNGDVESIGESAKRNGDLNSQIPPKIKPYEYHILKMGKCHQFTYFKCLKPAKYQLPVAFLIINIIYLIIILWITTGLPEGFSSPPEPSSSPIDFSCI